MRTMRHQNVTAGELCAGGREVETARQRALACEVLTMRRWIAGAVLLLTPTTMPAQVFTGPDWRAEISDVVYGPLSISGVLRVRNTFAFDPNRFFTITNVGVQIVPAGLSIGTGGTASLEGLVNTAPLGGVGGGQLFQFQSNYFGDAGGGAGTSAAFANPGSAVPNTFVNGLGLLGCSVPIIPGFTIAGHAGSTCANAGYTGALRIAFQFGYSSTPPQLGSTPFTPFITGEYRNVASINVVPEPSTWLLMAAGLLAIGAIARRRRA
jgi:hypothetical protein